MVNPLKTHPFPVSAHFDYSIVLTFAFPKEVLQPLIPEHFELDLYQEQYAFLAIAFVQTQHLRPTIFAESWGKNFALAGYRIFVKYTNPQGITRRGLYIIKSQTDKRNMVFFGNLFTHYNYEYLPFQIQKQGQSIEITSTDNLCIRGLENHPNPRQGMHVFPNVKEARKFAGPMPYTFTYDAPNQRVISVKGQRKNWQPEPIFIEEYQIPYLTQFETKPLLANAFITQNIDYEWNKGMVDNLN